MAGACALAWPAAGWAGAIEASLDDAARAHSGIAVGATGTTFVDPTGDNEAGLAPDVTTVEVSNDAAGLVTLRVDVPNVQHLRDGDFLALFLDTDLNPATGSATADGADHAIAFDGATGTIDLARWTGKLWDFATPAATFRTVWSRGPTITVHRSELGATRGFSFWIGASWSAGGARFTDIAPDAGTWSFSLELPPGASDDVARPAADTRGPTARALRSGGPRGGVVWLRYRVSDDSGETRERIEVFRGRKRLATVKTAFATSRAGIVYSVAWRAPRAGRGPVRFCVTARDRAGHSSRRSCAGVQLVAAGR